MERYAKEARDYPLTNVNHLSARAPRVFKGETMDITFTEEDAKWVHHPHNDALVVAMRIAALNIHRVFVDNGSSVNILYYDTYKKMGLPDKDMTVENLYIYGFGGEAIKAKGTIRLPVTLGEAPRAATQVAEFVIIDHPSAHNALMGRPLLKDMKIITSIYHLTLKFPTPGGVGCVKGSQYESRDCYGRSLKNFRDKRGVPPHEELHSVHVLYLVQYPESDSEDTPSMPLLGGRVPRMGEPTLVDDSTSEECEELVIEVEEAPLKKVRRMDPQEVVMELEEPSPPKKVSKDAPSEPRETPHQFDFDLDPRLPMQVQNTGPAEDTIDVQVTPGSDGKILKIGSKLGPEIRSKLIEFLTNSLDVFAWSHEDMVGIDPAVMCHHLNVDPSKKGARQKRRPISGERAEALQEEVDRLLKAGLVKESFYPKWLANPVLVKKPNGKWRTCIDFTDLNKACPKDSFPLPRIDQLVDSTAGHTLLSFMDAYSGYNQIPMYEPDQEHTSFITDRGLYCYIGMPFGLINAGATYQRLVNMMFKDQIGKTMEVYVDDMLVKSKKDTDHVAHLSEMFEILRKYRMKLNPQKCVFGVESGKFLGFMVNHRGIEANLAKIKALLDMKSPANIKQVQSLTGRIAALNRFVSKSSEKCKEFFKAIKGASKDFEWTEECEDAFVKIKKHLGEPPLLAKPQEGETLVLYLAVSDYSISAVLVKEDEEGQSPIYYVSKRLLDAETRYTSMEKMVYALVHATRKLRPYFQAHKVEVRTAYPLRQIMHKPEVTGRMMKWAVELGQFDLDYKPRTAIKGQALADFILEFPEDGEESGLLIKYDPDLPPQQAYPKESIPELWWILHTDGAVNNEGAGAGIVLVSPEGHRLLNATHFTFQLSNNDAEYEALIGGLRLALEMKVRKLVIKVDSMLVVEHIKGGYQAKGPKTAIYLRCVQGLLDQFEEVQVNRVPREFNGDADALAKLASQKDPALLGVIRLEIQEVPSIPELEVTEIQDKNGKLTWMTPIWKYIKEGTLPEDKAEARRLKYKAARYVEYDVKLYKRGFNQPLLKCVDGEECTYVMREVHEGICGNHSGGNSLAMKILRQGYYWPTLRSDAFNFARACDKCQRFANFTNSPATSLTTMTSPWPFAMWGIDLIGELPKAKGGVKYAVVAVDYFTKWAEAAPLATITAKKITDFVFNSIVCRLGVPYKLISDNGKQFDSKELRGLCDNLGIKKDFAAVYHPQSNGQTEAVNKIIKHTLKTKLEDSKGNWPEELPMVLWSYNTTPRTTTGESPFVLSYGCEAMVPIEIGAGSFRRDYFDQLDNDASQRLYLDMIEEIRATSQLRLAAYQRRTARYYNNKVKAHPFQVGDLVLRKVVLNNKNPQHGVFGANWEGPYRVKVILWKGTYRLEDLDGKPVPRPWNAEHLKKYYQ
ncbi:uncharacterized protein LOC135152236 [Daucus carota subsp. sativus]|uniref:uncharacterized protein LOC135152236 n=1 Tax=Daucus carota subsp. sativus TaxID=79200 RepID=UPI003083988D